MTSEQNTYLFVHLLMKRCGYPHDVVFVDNIRLQPLAKAFIVS